MLQYYSGVPMVVHAGVISDEKSDDSNDGSGGSDDSDSDEDPAMEGE
jgi:hypothetical protein